MYRNAYYNSRKKCVELFTWNETGKRVHRSEPFNPYLYVESSSHKDAISVYNTNLRKLVFPNNHDRRRYLQESGIKRIFYNIPPAQQFLIEQYGGLQNDPNFSKYPLKIFYLDIETFSPYDFPVPEQAKHKVNLITIFDTLSDKYYTFGLEKDYTPKNKNSIYFKCKDEVELLEKFINFWSADYPDVVVGWNSEQFDIPYLINRIKNILGDDIAQSLSPVGSIFYKEDVRKQFGKDRGRWSIHGVNCIDYMEAYKLFSRDKRESYSLNYIAMIELNEGKLGINATNLAKLSESDWNNFVDYNIQDVALLLKLEEKLRFLQIMRTISYKGFTSMESAMGKVAVVTGAIAQQALEQGKILSTFVKEDMGTYNGGFVRCVEPNLFEYIVTFDANSLYPNTILTLNLSPETKIGKITNIDKVQNKIDIKLVTGKTHNLDAEKFKQFLNSEKIAVSRAKILFSQKEKGIIPKYVASLYAERVKYSDEVSRLEQENLKLDKNSDQYKENRRIMKQLDILQHTLKILLNSIYGVFGNIHSAFYDLDLAGSITNTGQSVIIGASDILNKYARDVYKVEEDIVRYNDTDSTHVSLKPILVKHNIQFLDDKGKVSKEAFDIIIKMQDHLNKEILNWARRNLYSLDPQFFFKREAICPAAIYQSKKHYILHVKDKGKDKPVPCDYIKYVGVEIAKTTVSEPIKNMMKKVIESIIYTKDKNKTNEIYRQVYEDFKKLPLSDIAQRQGISNYDKYAKKANGFIPGKGTPHANKAAIAYNALLKELNIDTIYDPITNGSKIKMVHIIPNNKYGISKIAFANEYPKEFESILKPDYELIFEKMVSPAIDRFYDCVRWKTINMRKQYACDLFDILGD